MELERCLLACATTAGVWHASAASSSDKLKEQSDFIILYLSDRDFAGDES
jgi:hypothetical protein